MNRNNSKTVNCAIYICVALAVIGVPACEKKKEPAAATAGSTPAEAGSEQIELGASKEVPGAKGENKEEGSQVAPPASVDPEGKGTAPEAEETPGNEDKTKPTTLNKATAAVDEFVPLLSKMLREMKTVGEDPEKMAQIRAGFSPDIERVRSRCEAILPHLTEEERGALQQHGIGVLESIAEDFVGLPAEAVIPIADEIFKAIGTETQHEFE